MEINYEIDFDILLKGAIEIGNSISGKENINLGSLIYAEGLGQKIIHHALSVKHLFNGYQLTSDKFIYQPVIDFASIAILTRASLETYLTLNYIFIDSKDDDERNFKILCWDLAGYLDRQDHIPILKEQQEKLAQEREVIGLVKGEIQGTKTYKELTTKCKNLALKGKWRLEDSWSTLAVKAKFNKMFFDQQYKFLCAYAHSSRLSVIQILQAKK